MQQELEQLRASSSAAPPQQQEDPAAATQLLDGPAGGDAGAQGAADGQLLQVMQEVGAPDVTSRR